MSKTLVIYSYYQKNDEYVKNLEFFIKNAIYDDIDYIFCINGKECSISIPSQPNIKLLPRDNKDYDFGAYSDALETVNIDLYDYFFFINTSVRGPFLPEDIRSNTRWTAPFIKLLTDDVKLVGTSINIFNITDPAELNKKPISLLTETGYNPPFAHVQSQVFLLGKEGLQFLISKKFFEQPPESDFDTFIILREVMLSQLILKNNWNINCILKKYQGVDYRNITEDINTTSVNGDPYYIGAYFGENIKPYDVIFIKTNRNVSTDEIIQLTDDYYIYNTHPTNYIETFEGGDAAENNNFGKYIRKVLLWTFILILITSIIKLIQNLFKKTKTASKYYRKK